MNLKSALLDSVHNSRDTPQVGHTLLNVQLRQLVLLLLSAQLVQSLSVVLANLAHRLEPHIQNIKLVVRQRGLHTTARGVSAEHDVLDFEVLDAELDSGEEGDVGRVDDVGDVAQHEDLTRLLAQHGGLGDARVAAANPQDVGRLALGAVLEELGVFGGDVRGPQFVGLEGGGEFVVWEEGGRC